MTCLYLCAICTTSSFTSKTWPEIFNYNNSLYLPNTMISFLLYSYAPKILVGITSMWWLIKCELMGCYEYYYKMKLYYTYTCILLTACYYFSSILWGILSYYMPRVLLNKFLLGNRSQFLKPRTLLTDWLTEWIDSIFSYPRHMHSLQNYAPCLPMWHMVNLVFFVYIIVNFCFGAVF